jgi:hypothetical protein
VITGTLNVAIENGYILDRWKDIIHVMLEKTPGKPTIHKLRVINLFESDFNLAIGLFYKKLVSQAERVKALGNQQFGFRKGKSTEDVILLKNLSYQLMAMTRTDGVIFDNDARACFDRMIPNMWNLCAQQLGLDTKICDFHASTLKEARYRLKTSIGISETSYSSTETTPFYGAGQGARNAATIWTIISCNILKIMEKHGGASFMDPTKTKKMKRTMDAFADDSMEHGFQKTAIRREHTTRASHRRDGTDSTGMERVTPSNRRGSGTKQVLLLHRQLDLEPTGTCTTTHARRNSPKNQNTRQRRQPSRHHDQRLPGIASHARSNAKPSRNTKIRTPKTKEQS